MRPRYIGNSRAPIFMTDIVSRDRFLNIKRSDIAKHYYRPTVLLSLCRVFEIYLQSYAVYYVSSTQLRGETIRVKPTSQENDVAGVCRQRIVYCSSPFAYPGTILRGCSKYIYIFSHTSLSFKNENDSILCCLFLFVFY